MSQRIEAVDTWHSTKGNIFLKARFFGVPCESLPTDDPLIQSSLATPFSSLPSGVLMITVMTEDTSMY